MIEWTSGRMVGLVNVINVLFRYAEFGDVSWVGSLMFMSSIF